MVVCVTGAGGYIGSVAVKRLLLEGHEVIAMDDLSRGYHDAIDQRATFVKASTLDQKSLMDMFKTYNVEAVMHFAAYSLVGESVDAPLTYYHNNVEGTRTLLEAMHSANIKKMVFSSSAAVYGDASNQPIAEDAPLNPTSPYGETKRVVEGMLAHASKAHAFAYVSLRYFNVAGASKDLSVGERHDPETHLIPNVIKSIVEKTPLHVFGTDYNTHDGSAIRDYIDVEDLIDAHIKALNYLHEGNDSEIFNLGTAKGASVLEVVKACERVSGETVLVKKSPRRQGDPAILVAAYDKAKAQLNWTPTTSLETMIERAYQFYLKKVALV